MTDWDAWTVPARVERVVDGDTLDLTVDLGFRARMKIRIRLRGLDTAEIYGVSHDSEEYETGKEHTAFVEDWVATVDGEWPFFFRSERESGKYGRWVGDLVRREDGMTLTDALLDEYPEVESDG